MEAGKPQEREQEREKRGRVVDLEYYRIRKSLRAEGFDVIPDGNGKPTLILRIHPSV